jgi:hypothetical protein
VWAQDRPTVFVHGLQGNANTWNAAANRLRADLAISRDCLGGGVNLPWNLLACIAIGIVLMFSRLLFGSAPPLAHADHLLGALIITFAVAALAEVARPVRLFNVLLGAAVIGAPWLLAGGAVVATVVNAVLGLGVIALSLRHGAIRNSYGSFANPARGLH